MMYALWRPVKGAGWEWMGPGGPLGLQILCTGANTIRGGFDSHTFPPFPARLRRLLRSSVFGPLVLGWLAAASPGTSASAPAEARPDQVSPRGALLRSVAIPGWGQLATGHPRKAGVLLGGAAGLGAWIALETDRAGDAADRARAAATDEEFYRHKAERDRHVERRDGLVSWLLFLWMYNMLDAYIEGHFVDFDGLELRQAALPTDGRAVGSGAGAPAAAGLRIAVSW